jgi:nucleoid DNA-binding protein
MTKPMSKFELIQKIADQHSLLKKDVKSVTESPASMGYK